jgi:hypothetical protein
MTAFRKFFVLILAILFSLEMALPHILFAIDTGWGGYFDVAPDQSFYLMNLTGDGVAWNERPINQLNHLIWWLTGGSAPAYFILTTAIFSFVAFLGALFLVRNFLVRWWFAIICVPLIIFPAELLSLRYEVGFLGALSIHHFVASLPLELRRFFSDSLLTYFQLVRLPEPATTTWIFLFYSGFMTRLTLSPEQSSVRFKIGAFFFGGLLAAGYVFLSVFGVILAMVLYAVESLDERKIRLRFSLFVAIFSLIILITSVWISHRTEAHAFLFSSRLPLLSLSHLWGVLLIIAACLLRRRMPSLRHFIFAILMALVPVVMMNQQIVTGIMIQALNWERYVDYPCIIFSLLTILSAVPRTLPAKFSCGARVLRYCCVAAAFVLLGYLQIFSYENYWTYNVKALALSSALQEVYRASSGLPRSVVLSDMSVDQQIRPRIRDTSIAIDGYATIVKSLDNSHHVQQNKQLGFEYAFYQELSPFAFGSALEKEIQVGNCWPNSMYFFEFLNCAPYMSDFRKFDRAALLSHVASLQSEYSAFVNGESSKVRPVLFATTENNDVKDGVAINKSLIFRREYKFASRFGGSSQDVVASIYFAAPSARGK